MAMKTLPIKRSIITKLVDMSREYHQYIPILDIFQVLESGGMMAVQEDGTPWSGILCGHEGSVNFPLVEIASGAALKRMLVLSWYRMPSSRYEINIYFS